MKKRIASVFLALTMIIMTAWALSATSLAADSDGEITTTSAEENADTVISNVVLLGKIDVGKSLAADFYKSGTDGVSDVKTTWFKNGERVMGYNITGMGRYKAYLTLTAADGYTFADDATIECEGVKSAVSGLSYDKTTAYFRAPEKTIHCLHGSTGSSWDANIESHIRRCSICGEISEESGHVFESSTVSGNKTVLKCTVCGYEKTVTGLKTELTEILLDMPRLVAGRPLAAPRLTPEYDARTIIMSYQWYKADENDKKTKVSAEDKAEEGWYYLEVSAITKELFYFGESAVVLHPYGETKESTSKDTAVTSTIKIYCYAPADIEISMPRISPERMIGDICKDIIVTVNGEAQDEIELTLNFETKEYALKRSADGKWSLIRGGGTIDGLFKGKISPRETVVAEVEFKIGDKIFSTEDIKVECGSFEVGHKSTISNGWISTRITMVSETDLIGEVEITGVVVPSVGAKPDKAFVVDGDHRFSLSLLNWNTEQEFKCGEKYTVRISLVLKDEYKYDSNVIATINGVPATFASNTDGGKSVSYTFRSLEHQYGEWEVQRDSCSEEGTAARVCLNCGHEETKTVPPENHEYYEVAEVASTCMTHGVKAHIACKNCKTIFDSDRNAVTPQSLELPLDKSNHVGGNISYDENGHFTVCECGEKLGVEPHSFGEWTTVKQADVGLSGEKERVCSVCEYKETEEIPALPDKHAHDFSELRYDDEAHWHVCECGEATQKEQHNIGANGICSVCGYKSSPTVTETSSSVATTAKNDETPAPAISEKTVVIVWIACAAVMIIVAVTFVVIAVKKKK